MYYLGVPLAPGKKEGPDCRITFLGNVIDTRLGRNLTGCYDDEAVGV